MGGIFCITSTFPLGFLDLLRLRPAPATDIHPTVGTTILCSWPLEDATSSVGTLPASQVRTQAVLGRLDIFSVGIGLLFGHWARSCNFLFGCDGHDGSY